MRWLHKGADEKMPGRTKKPRAQLGAMKTEVVVRGRVFH
jgi:hypothetical protein